MQKIREAERDKVYDQFEDQIGTVVSAVVHKLEGPNVFATISAVGPILGKSTTGLHENAVLVFRLIPIRFPVLFNKEKTAKNSIHLKPFLN